MGFAAKRPRARTERRRPNQAWLVIVPGLRSGLGTTPGRQLVIVQCGFGRWFGAPDRVDLGVGQVFHSQRLTIPPHQAFMLGDRRTGECVPFASSDGQSQMTLNFSFAGQVRRIDALLRSRFPHLRTRIFEIRAHHFTIVFDSELQSAQEISEDFDNAIRFMTVPVTLSNHVPETYVSEIASLSDEDATGSMIGLPLRCIDLLNLLTSRFPDAGIIRVADEPSHRQAIVVVRCPLDADTEGQLTEFIESFQLPLALTIEVSPSQEAAARPDIDDHMFVWAASLRPRAPTYVKKDEMFWFDNIADISSNRLPVECFPGLQDAECRCYFDLSLGEDHMNLRQALLMYDKIWCSVPLVDKQDDFLAGQRLTKADLLEMVSAGRLRIVTTQPEERLDIPFLDEVYERNPESVLGRRTTASLLVADVARMAEHSLLNDPDLLPGLSEYAKECGPVIEVEPNYMLRSLLWPFGSRRGSLHGLLARGSKAGPVSSLAELISDRVKEEVGMDIALEAYVLGEPVHIGHSLGATVFGPINEPDLYYRLKSVLGGYLNLHKHFTATSATSWINNEQRRKSGTQLLPSVQVFEFDRHIPIKEIIDDNSLVSARTAGRGLYSRLSQLEEEERGEEIKILNMKFREMTRRKSRALMNSSTVDTAVSLASLFAGFPYPPIMGLVEVGSRVISNLRRSKRIDSMMSRLEEKIGEGGCKGELDFLSQIDRVASFRVDRV